MTWIEFCGGIGAGKSSCASALADHWSVPLVTERFEAIPYWQLYYEDPRALALEKDLNFLLSHAEGIRAAGATRFICDFAMFQTVAYSSIAGDRRDREAVHAVYQGMARRLGRPAIVVRLTCAIDVQLERIGRRGRRPEQAITASYLEDLDSAIDVQLRELPEETAVICFDTTVNRITNLLELPEIIRAAPDWQCNL